MSSMSRGRAEVVYDGAVTPADLDQWESDIQALAARVGPLFSRAESKRHAEQYLRGLTSPLERKNGWTISEFVGEKDPKPLQRFLNLTPWDAEALLTINREYAMEHLANPGAVLVADPTGFEKKGKMSVGVQRQYSGTLGRIDNCQIGTFICYVTPDRDRVLIDRRLYMPEESWLADPDRCAAAGVPQDLTFHTRPEQVIAMIRQTREAGIPFAWFTADEEFGQNPALREYLETDRIPYVMAVPKNTLVITATGREQRCDLLAAELSPHSWHRRACGIGSKGFRVYDWALVETAEADQPFLFRRSVDDGELAYYRCYNPDHAPVTTLVHVAGARWPIEECFGSAKNETALDHYQVRTWNAWHRYTALAMLAHTFLAITAHNKTQKKGAQTQAPAPQTHHRPDPTKP